MRKIDGPGAVDNAFLDYDATTNPDGTVYTADYGNDVQDELVAIQDEYSIAEAAGANGYVLAAIKGMCIGFGKHVGELFFLDDEKDPAEFDEDSPGDFFPAKCLDTIDGYEDISSTNWPDLVTHLRTKTLTYAQGTTSETSSFAVDTWSVADGVAKLSFSGDASTAMLNALAEDKLVHGSCANWRYVTLKSKIGNILAGEYAITTVDTDSLYIDFQCFEDSGSGTSLYSVYFYENRIPGSTTTARLYQSSGRALVSANDDDFELVSGLRRRDRMQGHYHDGKSAYGGSTNVIYSISGTSTEYPVTASSTNSGQVSMNSSVTDPSTDDTNGTPRTGTTTDPRALIGHLYIHGRTYTA